MVQGGTTVKETAREVSVISAPYLWLLGPSHERQEGLHQVHGKCFINESISLYIEKKTLLEAP